VSPDRLRACIEALGWTQRGLARMLGRHEGTVRQWARGTVSVPDDVAAWLETRASVAEVTPAPVRKPRRFVPH
jgi:transcriptional regulator with XRE-family HTH domain